MFIALVLHSVTFFLIILTAERRKLFAFFRNASPPLLCWFILSFSSYSERDYLPKATQHDITLGCKKSRCHNTPPAKSCRETRCATAPEHHSVFITDQLLLALHPGAVGRRRARWQLVLVLCVRGLCFRLYKKILLEFLMIKWMLSQNVKH